MANSPSHPDDGSDAGAGPARSSPATGYPGTPRWVKVSGLVALVLILLVVVAAVASGGQHGPMRHLPSSAPGHAGSVALPAAPGVQQA